MPNNFLSLLILLVAALLLLVNQFYLNEQIPQWIFILLLVLWVIVKFWTFRNRRK